MPHFSTVRVFLRIFFRYTYFPFLRNSHAAQRPNCYAFEKAFWMKLDRPLYSYSIRMQISSNFVEKHCVNQLCSSYSRQTLRQIKLLDGLINMYIYFDFCSILPDCRFCFRSTIREVVNGHLKDNFDSLIEYFECEQ